MVDVSGDGPDELQTIEQCRECLIHLKQVTLRDDFELSLQSEEELNKVTCYGLLLNKFIILLEVVGKVETILLLNESHDVKDILDLGHTELLVQGVERSITGAPVLGLFGGRFTNFVLLLPLSLLALNRFLDGSGPLFNCGNELRYEVSILGMLLKGPIWRQLWHLDGDVTISLLQRQLDVPDEFLHHDTFVLLLLHQRQVNPLDHICEVVKTTLDLNFLVFHKRFKFKLKVIKYVSSAF